MAAWCYMPCVVGRKPEHETVCFFRVKWLQPAMKATSSVRRLRLGSFGSFYVFCNNACSCVRSSNAFLAPQWCKKRIRMARMTVEQGLCCGQETHRRKPNVFPAVKWLQQTMVAFIAGCATLRLEKHTVSCSVLPPQQCMFNIMQRSSNAFLAPQWCKKRIRTTLHDVEHGLCVGQEAGARNRVFFRVKWLQPAMKATSSVRRLRLGSFGSFYVFCNNACSCVRSSMRFLTLWCQIALEWLHDVACRCVCGEEAGARNRVFFRVKWLQPAMKATSSVRRKNGTVSCSGFLPTTHGM